VYPKANTSGCTKQACGFNENLQTIREAGYGVVGLSFDKPEAQAAWKGEYSLQYPLLTDVEGVAIKALGAYKGPGKILRTHVIVAKGGEILDIQNGISSGDSHVEALKYVTSK
jgi:thioredoxin-dependent peroxiredoxin